MTLYRDIHGPTLYDEEAAREFVFALSLEERQRLLAELHKFTGAQSSGKLLPLQQLGFLYFTNCLSISLCLSVSLSLSLGMHLCGCALCGCLLLTGILTHTPNGLFV